MAGPVTEDRNTTVHVGNNGGLIEKAASLWIRDGDHVLDVTYGRGNFWSLFVTEQLTFSLTSHDLTLDAVDFRHLPEKDESVDVVVFDPPYIPQGGRTTSTCQDFITRYGLSTVPATPSGVDRLLIHGMVEAARVLKSATKGYAGGRLLVKCKDYVSSGHWHGGAHTVRATATLMGLEQVDEYVHNSGTGPQPLINKDGTKRRQLHARSAHSFLCVFQKGK